MHIIEIVIEGFKSYATRTVLSGFDENFNAITGLNGSGKSNIIDAIIFVLGMSTWSKLRASNLQDLIYKQGQTGVRKASVTLVFDNTDKSTGPVGYEDFDEISVTRQVIVGGRSKYLINGHTAQNERVKNLFRSVQLNVNNPHFLIMQGKITKVLNMKPDEILGMIKEAAGTKMYEDKKEGALKTIRKKDTKVQEITSMLDEEITPTLNSLRKQQEKYMRWLDNKRELERLERVKIAYYYWKSSSMISDSPEDIAEVEERVREVNKNIKKNKKLLKEYQKEILSLTEEKEDQMSGDIIKLEEKVKKLSKKLIEIESSYKNQEISFKKENKRLQNAIESKETIENKIVQMKTKLDDSKADVVANEERKQTLAQQIENLKRSHQALVAGVQAGGEGSSMTLTEQLMAANREKSSYETKLKASQHRLEDATQELEKIKVQKEKADDQYNNQNSRIKELSEEIKNLRRELDEINFSEDEEMQILEKKKQLSYLIQDRSERIQSMRVGMSKGELKYRKPTSDFDTKRVHGMAANYFDIKDSRYSVALETAAGGKLWNIIVDTDETATLLFKRGDLRRRITFLPLNKLKPHLLRSSQVKAATKLVGKEEVSSALDLIEYKEEHAPAIEHIFGNILICNSLDSARIVTFDKNVKAKSVTIEGDIYDPSGMASGGSAKQSRNFLEAVQELKEQEKELQNFERELAELNQRKEGLSDISERYYGLRSTLELKEREIELLKQRIAHTPFYQIQEKTKGLKDTIKEEKRNLTEYQDKLEDINDKISGIESQMENFDKDDQLTKTLENISKKKEKLSEASDQLAKAQKSFMRLNAKLEQLEDELASTNKQIDKARSEVEKLTKSLEEEKESLDTMTRTHNDLKNQYEDKKLTHLATDSRISNLIDQRDSCNKNLEDMNLELKKLKHKLETFNQSKDKARKKVRNMREKHEWIAQEEEFFGQENGDYDFTKYRISEIEDRLKTLEEEQNKLSKRINKKVTSLFEKAEQEYSELIEKKDQIEADKAQIEKFIDELDKKKNRAVRVTYEKVNNDFGAIFETLLPGATAKLVAEQGKEIHEGLEVKVAFGDDWKESLSELSGGQRSLLALSLILSLLLFKPAPMYILDEIDSALDLSHTQNIGEMLRTHFHQSQFIIISLKEGMFNNANVVFKVSNVNGSSQVSTIKSKDGRSSRRH
eukprot:TRINITY_DN2988_c0_g1_i1.p1 TRINITY_DN2988_c0_g1~~TRINITY_DN2988_c0_g1_i1.p1  ORF type:complete len:1181 (-),score=346.90 TRINITY_DN2988_c0_g1_i1:34-3576(-)